MQTFHQFYEVADHALSQSDTNQMTTSEDNFYLLNKTLGQVQQFVKSNPTQAIHFYDKIQLLLSSAITETNIANIQEPLIHEEQSIINPQTVRSKGRPKKKRIKSALEDSKKYSSCNKARQTTRPITNENSGSQAIGESSNNSSKNQTLCEISLNTQNKRKVSYCIIL